MKFVSAILWKKSLFLTSDLDEIVQDLVIFAKHCFSGMPGKKFASRVIFCLPPFGISEFIDFKG